MYVGKKVLRRISFLMFIMTCLLGIDKTVLANSAEGIDICDYDVWSVMEVTLSGPGVIPLGDKYYYKYDGKPKEPHVTIKYKNKILQEGMDYQVKYENNIGPGTGEANIYNKNGIYSKHAYFIIYKTSPNYKTVINNAICTSIEQIEMDVKLPKFSGEYYEYDYYLLRSKNINGPYDYYDGMYIGARSTIYTTNGNVTYHPGLNYLTKWAEDDPKKGTYYLFVTAPYYKKYYYKVVGISNKGEYSESKPVACTAKLSKPYISNWYVSANNKSAVIMWNRVPNATGYQLYRKEGSGSWKIIKTFKNKYQYKDKHIKAGKTYKYRIRAYKKGKNAKTYSDYSVSVTLKIKSNSSYSVKGDYKSGSEYGAELSSKQLTELQHVVYSFKKSKIKSGISDYDKAVKVYLFVRNLTGYSMQDKDYDTAWGALVNRKASCYGFAKGVKALCDAIGLKCCVVYASKKASNPYHCWNMVKISGKWYILDAQAGVFLCGSKKYKQLTGERWETSKYPKCQKKDYKKAK